MAPAAYDATAKAAFHRVAKKYLRRLATTLALPAGSFEIRSNQGGVAVSGEVILRGEHLYVWVERSWVGPRERVVWYRGCHGRHDYTGMENHTADVSALVETTDLAANCKKAARRAEATETAPKRVAA